jgi:hypothetical protein
MVNQRDGNNNLAKLFIIAALVLAVIVFAWSWKSSQRDTPTTNSTPSSEETDVPSAESYTDSPPSSTTLNEGTGSTSTDNNPGSVSNEQ